MHSLLHFKKQPTLIHLEWIKNESHAAPAPAATRMQAHARSVVTKLPAPPCSCTMKRRDVLKSKRQGTHKSATSRGVSTTLTSFPEEAN